ncbi:ParB/RepB/Spo0J family partition protein [Nitrosococcus oceani]|nr:ParB/RepB/Spo0J family partition protein [Nitrosococcus oceani]
MSWYRNVLTNLRENPDQPRKAFDEAALQKLADSIEQHGLIQSITVASDPGNEEGYMVVAGERRFRAFKQLGRETIPAIVTQGNRDEIALIENLQRENLNPLEEAEALA